MANLAELRSEKAKLISDARKFNDECDERGSMSGDDEKRFSTMMDDAFDIGAKIDREDKLRDQERSLGDQANEATKPETDQVVTAEGEVRSINGKLVPKATADRAMAAYNRYLRDGISSLNPAEQTEVRALEAGSDEAGGFLVPLQEISSRLIKAVDDMVFIRRLATTDTVTKSESLGIPTLTDPADFDWATELAPGSEDSTMACAKR